jgi:hypothetical protein
LQEYETGLVGPQLSKIFLTTTYDNAGRIKSKRYGNSVKILYNYNKREKLTFMKVVDWSDVLCDYNENLDLIASYVQGLEIDSKIAKILPSC